MAYKKKSPIHMFANTNSIDEKTKVGPKVGGSVSGEMFSKKRIQEYKDRNWAMDHTTHSAIAAPKPPQAKNNITPTPYFPATKAKAPKAKAKAPKAPKVPKATKGLVKQEAKAIKPIKSKGLASKELILANSSRVSANSFEGNLKSRPAKKKAPKLAAKKATAPKSTKPTKSQKLRAKGEKALASGNSLKARRIRKRYDRAVAREDKK
jgi:hypothetical protein